MKTKIFGDNRNERRIHLSDIENLCKSIIASMKSKILLFLVLLCANLACYAQSITQVETGIAATKDKATESYGSTTEYEEIRGRIDDNQIYDILDQMPSFPGGKNALMRYLASNVKYPEIAEENGIQGRVIVQFVVEKDGRITDVKTMKSVDPSLDREAERVVRSMPKWQPGRKQGQVVRVKYFVPVVFNL